MTGKAFIRNHFRRYYRRGVWSFCWRIGVESTVAGLVAATLLFFLRAPGRDLAGLTYGEFTLVAIVICPVPETLLLQALPLVIARKLKASFRAQVAVGTCVFGLAHVGAGIGTVLAAGLVGGFYFSFTYAFWQRKGHWPAFLATAGSHTIHNTITVALAGILGG